MKQTLHFFVFAIFIALASFTSCVSGKKSTTAKAPVGKQKKDAEPNPILKEKTPAALKKHQGERSGAMIENKDVIVASPPVLVSQSLHKSYPSVTDVVWTKKKTAIGHKKNSPRAYRGNFILDNLQQSITYSENGQWEETRSQILPDQLPQNIYHAIQQNYPGVFIVSATCVKNRKTEVSYSAVIRKETESSEKEVFLSDKGTFLK